jgi:CO/xanthine dehydrogenase FAD-binding subunit
MVTHVLWPRQSDCGGFYEVSRRDGHGGVVGAAVSRRGDDIRVGLSGVCKTGLKCSAVAGVIAKAFPALPETPAMAAALRADVASRPIYGDWQAGARYRWDVAPEVIRRAVQSMLAAGHS